jgi:olefin beta-lactone synthetase
LPSLRRVLSAGAPVMPQVLENMLSVIHPDGQMHTPYGATEALPVASISAREVLGAPKQAWQRGAGICVGRRFPGIEWKVIRCVEGPIRSIAEAESVNPGTIGELIVRGPVVTREYATRVEWNERSKIADAGGFWHRMGDVGHLDQHDRFWFCGRATHRVLTIAGVMYTIPCEAIFNQHPRIFRSALVGVGEPGRQRPVIVCEPRQGQMPRTAAARQLLGDELRRLATAHEHTRAIEDFLFHAAFPVDIRHNAKIFREQLAVWAAGKLPPR